MGMAIDAIHRRIAQEHIGIGHVNLGAQHAGAFLKFAILHALKQIEVFLHGAIAIGAVHARLGERAAIDAHLLGRLIIDIRDAAADHIAGNLIQAVKEIGGKIQFIPFIAQPFDVCDESGFLLGGIGIVKAQIALAAIFLGNAKIDAQCLGVADMQITIRFRGKAGAYMVKASTGKVFVDKFLNKIGCASLFILHIGDLPQCDDPAWGRITNIVCKMTNR